MRSAADCAISIGCAEPTGSSEAMLGGTKKQKGSAISFDYAARLAEAPALARRKQKSQGN